MSYCSPKNISNEKTCYKLKDLKEMAKIINKSKNRNVIKVEQNKYQLWEALRRNLSDTCKTEWCWVDHKIIANSSYKPFLEGVFRPKKPIGKNKWLSTSNIYEVMKQYEDYYKDFVFFGPVPINFASIGMPLSRIDISKLKREKVKSVGIVFNTDPHNKPGQHWMSMFIDLKKNEINYFDSSPKILLPEIKNLIATIERQGKKINIEFTVNINTVRHQMSNTECGVYSIYFLTESLKGRSFDNIVNNIIKDNEMREKRKVYFRPHEDDK